MQRFRELAKKSKNYPLLFEALIQGFLQKVAYMRFSRLVDSFMEIIADSNPKDLKSFVERHTGEYGLSESDKQVLYMFFKICWDHVDTKEDERKRFSKFLTS